MGGPQLELTELSSCPICATPFAPTDERVEARDPFAVSDELFSLVRCDGCRTYVLNPRPSMEDMTAFYGAGFLAETGGDGDSLLAKIAARQQEFNLTSELGWLDLHLERSARYLDYSAGNGQIVQLIRRRRPDLDVFATEFSETYRLAVGRILGPDRVRADLAEFHGENFDLVSLFGVLEHVEDPRQLIGEISERLEIGGKVMITVPNIESFQKILFGRQWYSWVAPRHWHLMTKAVLIRLLEEQGFRVVDEKHFFLRTASSTVVLSIFPSLDPLVSRTGIRLLLYGFLFYLFLPLELLAAAFGRSGFLGLVAEKTEDAP